MMRHIVTPAVAVALITGVFVTPANSAEIRCLCPIGMRAVLSELLPRFEAASEHKVVVVYDTAGALTQRVQKGEPADVTIVSDRQIEALQKQDKVVANSRVDVARVGVGGFVRSGATKPDFASVDAFKRSILAAKTIAFGDPAGGSVAGVHMAAVLERLGIAAEMKSRTRLYSSSAAAIDDLAKGGSEIVFSLTSDIAGRAGIDLVGPLPAEIQSYTLFSAGIIAGARQPDVVKSLIAFLTSPASKVVMQAKGFEPR